MNKKGISPVIATTLLVSLTLILAAIIFLWARAFIPETILKGDYGRIEEACKQVNFDASVQGGKITVQNLGNVPIQSIQVGVKTNYGITDIGELPPQIFAIIAGNPGTWEVPDPSALSSGEVVITPILLGKTDKGESRAFVCGDESAKTIVVSS